MKLARRAGIAASVREDNRVSHVNDLIVPSVHEERRRRTGLDPRVGVQRRSKFGLGLVSQQRCTTTRVCQLSDHPYHGIDEDREVRTCLRCCGGRRRSERRKVSSRAEAEYADTRGIGIPSISVSSAHADGFEHIVKHGRISVMRRNAVSKDDTDSTDGPHPAANRSCLMLCVSRVPSSGKNHDDGAGRVLRSRPIDRVRGKVPMVSCCDVRNRMIPQWPCSHLFARQPIGGVARMLRHGPQPRYVIHD